MDLNQPNAHTTPTQLQINPQGPPTPAPMPTSPTSPVMINLTLTLGETNSVLQVLNTGPYSTVKPLIEKILEQAQPQAASAQT